MDLNKNHRYGYAHKQLRKRMAITVANGKARCTRCSGMILPTDPWDLDHTDDAGPRDYNGAAHRACNRATSGSGIANARTGLCVHRMKGESHGHQCCGASKDW